jgi:hypothetical protein
MILFLVLGAIVAIVLIAVAALVAGVAAVLVLLLAGAVVVVIGGGLLLSRFDRTRWLGRFVLAVAIAGGLTAGVTALLGGLGGGWLAHRTGHTDLNVLFVAGSALAGLIGGGVLGGSIAFALTLRAFLMARRRRMDARGEAWA